MPGVEIITGGSGSGKTREIVARLADLYRSDPFAEAVVLVPTIRHADQFRRRLVQECGVAMNLRVETLTMFARGLTKGSPILSTTRATDQLARVARRTVSRGGDADYFRPIAAMAGFVPMVGSAVGSLLEEDIDPGDLKTAAAHTGSVPARALAAIYAAYKTELAEKRLIHPSRVNEWAARAVHNGADVPNLVIADGFQRFTAGELTLLTALSEHADMTISFDPDASQRSEFDYQRLQNQWPAARYSEPSTDLEDNPPTLTKAEAANPEQHTREIARQIKGHLAKDPTLRPSDCAVTFRQVTPYLALMRRIFMEYDMPLDPAAGARLRDTPLGSWLNRLLGVKDNGWRVKDVIAILRSGVVNLNRWGLTDTDLDHIAQTARENKHWSGLETLKGLAANSPSGFAAVLSGLRELHESLEADSADRAQQLEGALYGENAWLQDPQDVDDETAQSIEQLRSYLTEMANTQQEVDDDRNEEEPFERFRERLDRRLAMPVLMRRTPGGVLLAPMHTMHGLRFKHVMVGGLSEGEFPAGRRYGDLLSDAMREELIAADLPLPPAPHSTEEELWQSVTSRADGSTALWRYRLNGAGKEATPAWMFQDVKSDIETRPDIQEIGESASVRELAIASSIGWVNGESVRPPRRVETDPWDVVRIAAPVEQRRRSFEFAGKYEGQISSGLAPKFTREGGAWSASSLDSYLTCSFQFFGSRVLGLNELEDEPDEGDGAMRGTVIHAILEEAFKPLIEQRLPFSDETIKTVIDYIDSRGKDKWLSAPNNHNFGQAALWRLEWPRYRDRIVSMLEQGTLAVGLEDGYRVLHAEHQFDETVDTSPPLRIRGFIDRVDETPDGLTIIDYKTGSIPTQKDVREGKSTQLALYALALRSREETKDARLRLEYWKLPARSDARRWTLDSAIEEDDRVINGVKNILQEKRNAVDAGDFRVNPTPDRCPPFCAMKYVCRVNALSRHKR